MTKRKPAPPRASPNTQTAPAGRAGGTYASRDFSRSARRSEFEIDQAMPREPAGTPKAGGTRDAALKVDRPYKDTSAL
ncbi:MAG TPA: hypothetical protein VGI79_13005 [Caulobacteraceae bacterium]|jgi:hypothetical protein